MGLGVLEDKYLGQDVPGTCLLDDLHAKKHGAPVVDPSRPDVKRSKDGIILVPQPSDSPNDPLNWPTWRKMALMLTITYGAGIVGAFGPIIGAGLVQVAENLNTDVSQLSEITGDTVLAIGLVLFLTAPASVVWGRRPIFLIGNVLLLVSCIWSALAKSVGSLTAARVVGGAGMAPIECLVEATIGDIFFVHERGTWIALWSFALLAGIYGVSIVNGYLIQDVSWRACFWIEGGLCGLLLILTILFVPETAWVRPEVDTLALPSNPSPAGTTDTESSSQNEKASNKQVDVEVGSRTIEIVEQEKPYSYWRYLKLFGGRRYTSEKFWRIATRPFILICSPCVAWGALVYGTTQGWVVGLSVSISLLFSTPEYGYNFGAGAVGLMSGVGPFIATLLANAMAGPLSDYCVKWMARRNGGIYEPEFRLVLIIPTFFFQVMGWFGWAVSAHLLDPWIAPIFFYSVISFGLSLSSIAVVSYVVDAHPHYAPESFATINASKNIFVFGLTYYIIDWLNSQGVLKCFSTIGGLVVFVCVMTIPMYIYGKRARSWVHRTPWMLS